MANLINNIKKARSFVTESLWSVRLDKITDKRQGILVKILRVLSLSVKGFNEDNCLTRASALTYYILLSIVPILALAFAIAKGFGFEHDLQERILADNTQYKEILDNGFIYANKLLDNTKGGLLAGVGIILLMWSVISLLSNIEDSFNDVWNINKARNWFRKITDYLTIMIIAPIFIILSGSMLVLIQTQFKTDIYFLSHASTFFVKLIAYFFMCGMFTVLYMVMPNTKVQFKAAFFAAIFATILFELLQWSYITFQVGAARFNAIYGGFAALPLFLIFVQYSWYIVLYGAEISYSIQNVSDFELEGEVKNLSKRYKKIMAILICREVVSNFLAGKKAMSTTELVTKLDLPHRLASLIVNELVQCGVFSEIKGSDDKGDISYQPAVSDSVLSVKYLIDKLDNYGLNELPISVSEELAIVNRLMDDFDATMNNAKGNQLIKDIK